MMTVSSAVALLQQWLLTSLLLYSSFSNSSLRYVPGLPCSIKRFNHIQINVCISTTERGPCQPDTCANGGTCFETQSGYKCLCQVGYSGKSCSGNSLFSINITNLPAGSFKQMCRRRKWHKPLHLHKAIERDLARFQHSEQASLI